LSIEGKGQADATAHFLQGITFSAIYSSPLRRAVGTATALTKTREMAVLTIEELTEVDVGDWEGKTWQQIHHETPSQYKAFMSDCAKHPYAGGENLSQVQERVVPALERLAKQHLGTRIAVVAHNVVNRVAIAHCWQLPLHAARKIHQNNCGLNILTYSQETLKSVSVNAAFHLDAY